MKRKSSLFLLMVVLGIFCHGCASETTEENRTSEANVENRVSEENEKSVESESIEETNHDKQGNYDEYSGSWTTEDGAYTLLRAAEIESEVEIPGTITSETATPRTVIPNETSADWQEIYYERYYAIWDSEEMMLEEIGNRSVYRNNCSFYSDAVYYIEGGGGEYMMKTDISYLVEPLYPTDFIYIEEENFKDYPPLLLHILKNEIYARHGYIFQNEDLDNYFRGLIWYTPKYKSTEFDVSVFNDIEVYNLDILARLDTY